jgi:hypothetical protein
MAAATCSICHLIMHDPAHLECACTRSFCHVCITAWQKKNDSCPLCNTAVARPAVLRRAPMEWSQALDGIKRRCPNNSGCKYKRSFYFPGHAATEEHARTECVFRRVTCPNDACDDVLEHRQLKQHVRLCQLKRCKNFRAPRFGCAVLGTAECIRQHELKCCFGEEEVLKQIEELASRI